MLAHVQSSAVLGIDAYLVDVEVDVSNGLPFVAIVGLPDAAVNESKERVRTAIKNSGFYFPFDKRVIINLAPADVRKAGPSFDLPIALGILASTGQIPAEHLEDSVIIGELSLDGAIRPVTGVLPVTIGARERGFRKIYLPEPNAREASVVSGLDVYAVSTLAEAVRALTLPETLEPTLCDPSLLNPDDPQYIHDFADVKGHAHVRRALEVAAAGGHNLLLIGPPGSGKTMMARRLPSILPPMTAEESLQTTKIFSVAGLLPPGEALVNTRPFRAPHHTVSTAALIGGGTIPRPGEVSLASNGLLFLDEFPEFSRDALEVLRQPLEDGVVQVSRVHATIVFPAEFMLVAAMNPCPCGFYGDAYRACTCSSGSVSKYLKRISGPLLDRIDLHLEVPRLSEEELMQSLPGEPSRVIRERVARARWIQAERFREAPAHPEALQEEGDEPHPADFDERNRPIPRPAGSRPLFCNAQMGPKELRAYCAPSDEVKNLLRAAIAQLGLSARAYDRLLKVARTIADLACEEDILTPHVAEAIQYRSLDRKIWGR